LGVDRRDERDLFGVTRPDGIRCAGGERRQLPCFPSVEADDPQLAVAGAVGLKEDRLAVGTPAGVAVFLAGGVRQSLRLTFSIGRRQPDRGWNLVGFLIDLADYVGDELAVGADL